MDNLTNALVSYATIVNRERRLHEQEIKYEGFGGRPYVGGRSVAGPPGRPGLGRRTPITDKFYQIYIGLA